MKANQWMLGDEVYDAYLLISLSLAWSLPTRWPDQGTNGV